MAIRAATRAYERLNISLPRETLGLLDRVTTKGTRSRFIDQAIRDRVASLGRARLRKRLEDGYAARAADNLRMAEEWFGLEEEAWETASRARRLR